MIPLPFKTAFTPFVTQEYGNTSNTAWYKANGINIPFHNGLDLCFGDAWETLGTPCLAPYDGEVVRVYWDMPTSTKGNGVIIRGKLNGFLYETLFWHSGEVVVKEGQQVKKDDLLCYVGNSGLVSPKPTIDTPAGGSHCHFGLKRYSFDGLNWNLDDANNGVEGYRNPRELYDVTQWKVGQDSGKVHDGYVLVPFIKNMSDGLVAYLKKIKFW